MLKTFVTGLTVLAATPTAAYTLACDRWETPTDCARRVVIEVRNGKISARNRQAAPHVKPAVCDNEETWNRTQCVALTLTR